MSSFEEWIAAALRGQVPRREEFRPNNDRDKRNASLRGLWTALTIVVTDARSLAELARARGDLAAADEWTMFEQRADVLRREMQRISSTIETDR